ncbi:MAG: FtsX-like permease family protein [Bacteroidota bacterium]|nr:FtsX-like permease family protein [Bacteroidota bacterium]MDP3146199.1 FtsX-like permease family protein [Bacteroidota bacterium]
MVSKKSNNAINIISWISIIAIAITTAALIIILSAMNGLTGTVANLYNIFEPDLKVTLVKGKYFEANEKLISEIKLIPNVKVISRTLSDKALLKNIDKQALVTIKGVDENFNQVAEIETSIEDGVYGLNELKKNNILLGRGIANQLQINIREFVNELSIFSPVKGKSNSLNPDDNFNQIYCTPTGIFSLNDEFDYQFAFVNIETAKKLFNEPNKVSALEILCDKGKYEDVQVLLQEKLGGKFIVKNRYQLNDLLFKTLETEKLATFIILAFILIIATFNIIGALTMLIIEKRKDIKTLYSMGASINLIRNIFMREGFLITGVGAIIGLLVGLLVCWLQVQFHLVKFGDEFIIPYYPIEIQIKDFVWILGLIMSIGFFAALYPVRVFTKMDLVH